MYTEKDLVMVAKRENNKKRNYLVVNRLQGKHIPVRASEAFRMFYELADQVSDCYRDEKILLIGFAETATAIGAAVAHKCKLPYIQTTRECVEGVQYLFFSEEHSHATEQKLVKEDLDFICKKIERIIFVEDEVTTGKTIRNIIAILKERYPKIKKYAVASLLNGMNEEAAAKYAEMGIGLHYLVKTDHSIYQERAESFAGTGDYFLCCEESERTSCCEQAVQAEKHLQSKNVFYKSNLKKEIEVSCCTNTRRLTKIEEYDSEIDKVWREIGAKVDVCQYQNVLVLGTEEFMYPALRIAAYMERKVKNVTCHSTTRSPILVSPEEDYPLHTRYELRSLYDKDRINFLYDMKKYECVFLITDAPKTETVGLKSVLGALSVCGNDTVYVVRWCLE